MEIVKFIPKFEAKTAGKVDPQVVHFAEQLDIIGEKFENRGHEDAAQGLPVPPDDVFQAWSARIFDDDPELAENIAELMRIYYMDGYRNGGAI